MIWNRTIYDFVFISLKIINFTMNASSTVAPTTVPVDTETDDDYGYDEAMATTAAYNSEQVTVMQQYLADECTNTMS